MPTTSALVRAALRVQEVLARCAAQSARADHDVWQRFQQARRGLACTHQRWRKAQQRNLALILPGLRSACLTQARSLRTAASDLVVQWEQTPAPVPSLSLLVAELRQLQDEFGELTINLKAQTLQVVTEAITLKEIALGPFALRLYWQRLVEDARAGCFEVHAMAPNPAASNEAITHPHVRDHMLCAGEAAAPLRKALEQGRLADAFCLVAGVLRHYNPQSPFVPLAEWEGLECYDCGTSISGDDVWRCERCDHSVCGDCNRDCPGCHAVCCRDCLQVCDVCERFCCSKCLSTSDDSDRTCCPTCRRPCAGCGQQVATDELDAQEHCPTCRPAPQPSPANPQAPKENVNDVCPANLASA